MKFTKPINREVDIDGNTFNVTFSDTGIEFRLKGKRKTARADWTDVLNLARGEQGESARELLGIETGASRQETWPQGRAFESQTEPAGEAATSEGDTTPSARDDLSRSVTAGEVGPES